MNAGRRISMFYAVVIIPVVLASNVSGFPCCPPVSDNSFRADTTSQLEPSATATKFTITQDFVASSRVPPWEPTFEPSIPAPVTMASEDSIAHRRRVLHRRVDSISYCKFIRRNHPEGYDSFSSPGPRRIMLPARNVTALVGIIAMLCTSIIIFACWRLWVWRRNIANERRIARRKLSQPFDIIDITLPASPEAAVTRDSLEDIVSPRPTVSSISPQPTIFSPLKDKRFMKYPSLGVTPPPVYAEFPVSALRPRISSRLPSAIRNVPSRNVPRLVIVQSSFITTLHDELKIQKGEVLRVLQEYEDGWCYVQRVGTEDAGKGVVPRICVLDKDPA